LNALEHQKGGPVPRTVELLYHNGALVGHRESRHGVPIQWGSRETPENGYIVVRVLCQLSDIPQEYLLKAFGTSKQKLDESKMSAEERNLFKDEKRFRHRQHKKKHTVSLARFKALCADNATEWNETITSGPA
jgi:hypothetical protein